MCMPELPHVTAIPVTVVWSWLQGYHSPKAFIAAQSPMATTVDDFWSMIWENKSQVVVLLCQLVENEEVSSVHSHMCLQYVESWVWCNYSLSTGIPWLSWLYCCIAQVNMVDIVMFMYVYYGQSLTFQIPDYRDQITIWVTVKVITLNTALVITPVPYPFPLPVPLSVPPMPVPYPSPPYPGPPTPVPLHRPPTHSPYPVPLPQVTPICKQLPS